MKFLSHSLCLALCACLFLSPQSQLQGQDKKKDLKKIPLKSVPTKKVTAKPILKKTPKTIAKPTPKAAIKPQVKPKIKPIKPIRPMFQRKRLSVSDYLKRNAVIRQGRITDPLFIQRKVKLNDNREVKLRDIQRIAFREQIIIRQQIQPLLAQKGLMTTPVIKDIVKETQGAYVLESTTSFTITDPELVARHSPSLAGMIRKPKAPGTSKMPELVIDERAEKGLNDYLEEVNQFPDNHPLKVAARKGKKELFKAICDGKGDVTMTETTIIPKNILSRAQRNAMNPALQALLTGNRNLLNIKMFTEGFAVKPKYPHMPNVVALQILPRRKLAIGQFDIIKNPHDIDPFTPQPKRPTTSGSKVTRPGGKSGGKITGTKMPSKTTAASLDRSIADTTWSYQFVSSQTDDMKPNYGKLSIKSTVEEPLKHFSTGFRLERVEGSSSDYRIHTMNGHFLSLATDGSLVANAKLYHATVFRLAQSGAGFTLQDTTNDKYVAINREGFLASNADREDALLFALPAHQFKARVYASISVIGSTGRDRMGAKVVFRNADNGHELGTLRVNSRGYVQGSLTDIELGTRIIAEASHNNILFKERQTSFTVRSNTSARFSGKLKSFGEKDFTLEYMTGFTFGGEWPWSRKWDFPSGHFHIELGASLGAGFRAPVKIQGTMKPTNIQAAGSYRISSTLKADVFDANADYYRRVNMPSHQIFDGNEIVLVAEAYWHISFRALWITWYEDGATYGFNLNSNLNPAYTNTPSWRLEIPPDLTRTKFDFGILYGDARLGLNFAMDDARVHINAETLHSNITSGGIGRLALLPNQTKEAYYQLTLPQNSQTNRFGFKFKDPEYGFDVSVTPQVKASVTVDVDVWFDEYKRTFSTGWISLNSLKFDLARFDFERHEGTSNLKYGPLGKVNLN